jgi:hypothetical protein
MVYAPISRDPMVVAGTSEQTHNRRATAQIEAAAFVEIFSRGGLRGTVPWPYNQALNPETLFDPDFGWNSALNTLENQAKGPRGLSLGGFSF